jgi:hypothetical protein
MFSFEERPLGTSKIKINGHILVSYRPAGPLSFEVIPCVCTN